MDLLVLSSCGDAAVYISLTEGSQGVGWWRYECIIEAIQTGMATIPPLELWEPSSSWLLSELLFVLPRWGRPDISG